MVSFGWYSGVMAYADRAEGVPTSGALAPRSSGGHAVTGYDLTNYGLVLAIWGITWILFGSGLVYLLVRYFAREDAAGGAETPNTPELTTAPAMAPVKVERELVAAGHA
jgi:hypothetical protein